MKRDYEALRRADAELDVQDLPTEEERDRQLQELVYWNHERFLAEDGPDEQ